MAKLRLGIRGKLFALSIAVIAITVLVLDGYVSSVLRAGIEDRIVHDLAVRARLVAGDIEAQGGDRDWQAVAEELGRRALSRVTLIASDGTVVGDSEVERSRLKQVENHADRPEVHDALEHGQGIAKRPSATIHHDLLYLALPVREGHAVAVVRLAQSLESLESAVGRAREVLAWGTLFSTLAAAAFSSAGSLLLSRSLRALRATAERMARDRAERTRLRGGDEVGALGETLDRLAESLSESMRGLEGERNQLEAILETIVEGVLVIDAEGRTVMANRALRSMLGTVGRLIGRAPIESIRNADLAELLEQVRRAQSVRSTELDFAGLAPKRLRVQAAPLVGAAGKGVVAVFTDLTELRRLESMRRDFVANVSHELRTPIATVLAAAETLDSGALRDPAQASGFVQIILRQAGRLKELVEDLLALNRIEAQRLDLSAEPIDLQDLFGHLEELYRPAAIRRGAQLSVEANPEVGFAKADRRALEQVLSNLVDNAVKYAPGAKIRLGARREGRTVQLFVADTGPGIAREHLSRLFERFYRVDKGRSREVGGTGLGLAIVKHLTEAMGGQVRVESEVGRGTTFTVGLPLEPEAAAPASPSWPRDAT